MNKNILTIATGKDLYIQMAINLAYSFFLWNENSNIKFHLVTDQPQQIPSDLVKKIFVIKIEKGQLGEGFSSKLHLDKLAPEGQTLFIDSDCLIFGRLDSVFDRFKGHPVSVVGTYIKVGEWFGDIPSICQKYNIPHLIKFNGGIYYIEKGPLVTKVYETARAIEPKYDEIGFKRLRNKPNDEVIMSLAMQLHNQTPIDEDGTIMGEFVNFQSGFKGDLFKGTAQLYNTPNHKKYQPSWPLHQGNPLVVHFLGDYTNVYPYISFKKQLLFHQKSVPVPLIKLITFTTVALPWYGAYYLKEWLRPVFRRLIGVRKIKKSERIVD